MMVDEEMTMMVEHMGRMAMVATEWHACDDKITAEGRYVRMYGQRGKTGEKGRTVAHLFLRKQWHVRRRW
jgi:hypothetical protein